MEVTGKVKGLPENAYRKLQPGEEYVPIVPADKIVPEATAYSVGWGLFYAVLFSAAAAYLGLKIGQVFEAAIPIAILAVGASVAAGRKITWVLRIVEEEDLVPTQYFKKLKGSEEIWECRVNYGSNTYRILCFFT